MVALGPVPGLSRAKLTFMFLSHKQLAGASAGNERPLSVATVARSGAMPNWPAGDFKRISSALPCRTCSCLIVLKLDAKHNIWNQRVDRSRQYGKPLVWQVQHCAETHRQKSLKKNCSAVFLKHAHARPSTHTLARAHRHTAAFTASWENNERKEKSTNQKASIVTGSVKWNRQG